MDTAAWIGIVGLLITLTTLVGSALYRAGHHAARIEALEKWRESIRHDMHEISDTLTEVVSELRSLHTLVQERTVRRVHLKDSQGDS